MSTLIVEVCAVEEIQPHPNADRIERIRVKNWWCIAPVGKYKVGDKVAYIPPDSILPEELAEKWGIAKYCVPLGRGIDGIKPPGLRVRASRFRGECSFGTIQDLDDPSWPIGHSLREHYGITKYEPPVKALDGDAAPPLAEFHAYTDIENLGNFPGVLVDGEEVIVTEKLHGTNSRVGIVHHQHETDANTIFDQTTAGFAPATTGLHWQYVAGSHGTRRKEFNDKGVRSKYWFPFQLAPNLSRAENPMENMLAWVCANENASTSVICFGEIFGPGIQDMHYGQPGLAYRVFDIAVDGRYLDWDKTANYVKHFEPHIQVVPILYRGPFSLAKMQELVDGPTTMAKAEDIKQPFKGREGIVIKPVKERFDATLGGRAILKFVSVDYHERKNADKTEDH